MKKQRKVIGALCVISIVCACAHGTESAQEAQLVSAKAAIMRADYRGDLAGLARSRDDLATLADAPGLGYLARYWSGYAAWRIALNGGGRAMKVEELKANLRRAAEDFEASIRLNDRFADGYAAAALVREWLVGIDRNDPDRAALLDRAKQARALLAKAKQLEPDNPRVLLLEGNDLFFAPPAMGGDRQRAVELYRRAVAHSPESPSPHSPLPDWGRAEALMSLAVAHLASTPPDLTAARQEADEALRLEPEWSYVRDMLLPAIEKAAK